MTNVALFVNGSFYDTEFDRDHDWRMAGELYDRQPSTSNWQNSFFIVYQYYGNISILLLTLVCGLFGRCHDHAWHSGIRFRPCSANSTIRIPIEEPLQPPFNAVLLSP